MEKTPSPNTKYCYHCMRPIEQDSICPHCGKTTEPSARKLGRLRPGTVLHQRYLIGEVLGQGGFGITYIGLDQTLNMRVAVKEYFPGGNSQDDATYAPLKSATGHETKGHEVGDKLRFLREARILAFLDNTEAVVSVKNYFEENETAYIIMGYLEGMDLQELLMTKGPLTSEDAFKRMEPVVDALALVHEEGLIHRDVSPQNIKVLQDGTFKLMDFGSAKSIDPENPQTLTITLKPGYAPEEQYRSKGLQGPWSDIYALCATLYKCITGITPEDSFQRVCSDGEAIKWPSELGIEIDSRLEAAIQKGMSLKPKDRFQNIAEFKAFVRGEDVLDKTAAVQDIALESETATPGSAARPVQRVYSPEIEKDISTLTFPEEPRYSEKIDDGARIEQATGADTSGAVNPLKKEHRRGKVAALVAALIVLAGAGTAAALYASQASDQQVIQDGQPQTVAEPLPTASVDGYEGVYDGKPHGIEVQPDSDDATVVFSLEALSFDEYRAAVEAGETYGQSESPKLADAGELNVYYLIVNGQDLSEQRYSQGSASVKITKAKQKLKIAKTSYSLTTQSKSLNLKASAKGKLSYTSSNTSVVTVSKSGKVSVVGAGSATITVKAAATVNYESAKNKVKISVQRVYNSTSSEPYSSTQSSGGSSSSGSSGKSKSSGSSNKSKVKMDGWI